MDGIISGVEKYLREFILYVFSFFSRNRRTEVSESELDYLNKTVVFSILSAVIGAYLWQRYIHGAPGSVKDVSGIIVDNLMRWTACGLVLYLLLIAFRIRTPVLKPVVLVLKVFSVAHILSIYCAYVALKITGLLVGEEPHWAALAAYAIDAIILVIFLPREIVALEEVQALPKRRIAVAALYAIFAFFVVLGTWADHAIEDEQKPATPSGKKANSRGAGVLHAPRLAAVQREHRLMEAEA